MNTPLDHRRDFVHKILTYSSGFFLSISIITLSIILTFNFKFIYKLSYDYLPVESVDVLEKEQVFENYDFIIEYTTSLEDKEFEIPHLQSSQEGTIHFEDVRAVYHIFLALFIISALFCVLFQIIHRLLKINNGHLFVKFSSKLLILFMILFTIPSMVLFGNSFDWMHMLIFSNDYWLLDSKTDPIIDFLPQEYFLLCFIIIIGLILLSILILRLIYKSFDKERI